MKEQHVFFTMELIKPLVTKSQAIQVLKDMIEGLEDDTDTEVFTIEFRRDATVLRPWTMAHFTEAFTQETIQ